MLPFCKRLNPPSSHLSTSVNTSGVPPTAGPLLEIRIQTLFKGADVKADQQKELARRTARGLLNATRTGSERARKARWQKDAGSPSSKMLAENTPSCEALTEMALLSFPKANEDTWVEKVGDGPPM